MTAPHQPEQPPPVVAVRYPQLEDEQGTPVEGVSAGRPGEHVTVLGLDLSLTSTGYAILHPRGSVTVGRIRSSARGPQRLAEIRDAVTHLIRPLAPDLVAVEGYAFGRPNGMAALGELGGVIRLTLHEHGQAYVDVPPAVVKKYATGRGNASKVEVIIAARSRLAYLGTNDDEADALWLAHIAAAHLGHPQVAVPQAHAAALGKITAPVLGAQKRTLYATTPRPIPVSPDCVVAKHDACAGASWDDATDAPADCPCLCHRAADLSHQNTGTPPTTPGCPRKAAHGAHSASEGAP